MVNLSVFKVGDKVCCTYHNNNKTYGEIVLNDKGIKSVRLFNHTYAGGSKSHAAACFVKVEATAKHRLLKDMITEDIQNGQTPDLPSFRFKKEPLLIFLWDNMQVYQDLKAYMDEVGLNYHREIRVRWENALTTTRFVPWYNLEDDSSTYPAYCLEEFFDVDFINLPEYATTKPMPIKGRVLEVSREVLCEMDFYYDNQVSFTRVPVHVSPMKDVSSVTKAYTWLNSTDQISNDDRDDILLDLNEGISVTPFTDEEEYYRFS